MNVKVVKVSENESILEINTISGTKTLTINKSQYGHSYDDFSEWDITDSQYYDLEKLVDNVIEKMSGYNTLDVEW